MKPEFVDNRAGNLLVEALNGHLKWLRMTYAKPCKLSIATGYFNPAGFALIADEMEQLAHARLLLGAEPLTPPAMPKRKPGEPRGRTYEESAVSRALQAYSDALSSDRNLLGFTPEVDNSIKRLLQFLDSGRIEVRRYEKAFLHGKAFVFADDEGVISGSSNFTAAGLTTNLELNLGRYDPSPVRQVKDWFDSLWENAVPYDLSSIYKVRYQEYDPYLIYLRVLWERYGNELTQEAQGSPIRLTSFQKDGLFRARRILNEYNGVLFADGVGLGKTFIGGDLIRQAVQDQRQRALLVAPAALRDGTWERFADRYQLYMERISYEELAGERSLGGDKGAYLVEPPDRYSLVVVDEAQAFRNPGTERARALRRLLQGEPPKKLVMLTATPVNNSLWDLYYLLSLFVGHDARFADRGISSLKGYFAHAMSTDPYDLRPDMLFDVLDLVCVRRTRNFVKRYYPHDTITGPDGTAVPIRFPHPNVKAAKYDFRAVLPGFFDEFAEALMPEEGEPLLTLARYAPSRYLLNRGSEDEVAPREVALVGLLRSMLLKRLESSVASLAESLRRMIESHNAFLSSLSRGLVPEAWVLGEWHETDTDDSLSELLQDDDVSFRSATAYNVDALERDVESDRNLLAQLEKSVRSVTQAKDPKLKTLGRKLAEIVKSAEKEGLTEEDRRNKRKVIIFTYFEDTVQWIDDALANILEDDRALSCYQGRVATVGGSSHRRGVSREDAIFGFAPKSAEAPSGRDEDRFDILITTDVLAEGQNLQQCRNIINYDLPWNPMRLVQRHGRIDRIGSPHDEVFIWCFFPDVQLDELLGLEERIRRKLAQAAASIGIESEVIPRGATSDIVFAETRAEIDALRKEDPALFENAGEDPYAHTGEEYRQALRKGLEQYGDRIAGLPWAAGSGFRTDRQKGHFFCARVGDRLFMRVVPSDASPLVHDTLECLKAVTCEPGTERVLDPELLAQVYDAWSKARDDIYAEWMNATDPLKLQPKVRRLFKSMANHLRKYPPSDSSSSDIARVLDSIEAPWGARIERQMREVFTPENEDPYSVSKKILQKVRDLGLQPFKAPSPLPPIDKDEVALVCWMLLS